MSNTTGPGLRFCQITKANRSKAMVAAALANRKTVEPTKQAFKDKLNTDIRDPVSGIGCLVSFITHILNFIFACFSQILEKFFFFPSKHTYIQYTYLNTTETITHTHKKNKKLASFE